MTGTPWRRRAGDGARPDAVDRLSQFRLRFRLIDGRIGGRIHDQIAAGLPQDVLDARWIGEIKLGAPDRGLRPVSRARSARARAT